MTLDLYGAWLAAGNNLQPVGDWLAANWPWLTIPAAIAFAAWDFARYLHSDDYRTRNDRRAAWLLVCIEPRPEPGQPGSDDELLKRCRAICPDIREEKP